MTILSKMLLLHLLLYSKPNEKLKKGTAKNLTSKTTELKNNRRHTGDDTTKLENDTAILNYLLQDKDEKIEFVEDMESPGFFWHQHNDSRDTNLGEQAEIAREIGDRYGDKLLRDLRERSPMRTRREIDVTLSSRVADLMFGTRLDKHFLKEYASNIYKNKPKFRFITHHDPGIDAMKKYIARLMQDTVYETQSRMVALDVILNKYGQSRPFKYAYSLAVIKELLQDLKIIYTRLRRDAGLKNETLTEWQRRFHTSSSGRNLVYYTYAFAKFMDITYMVEQICDDYEKMKRKRRVKIEKVVNKEADNKDALKKIRG